jgi:signal transduction histidine kinase
LKVVIVMWRWFRQLNLVQRFSLAAFVVTLLAMVILAWWVGRENEQVNTLNALLRQNEELDERVRRAALRTAALNERFLRRVSAKLHDGPAQDLGFALIKLESGEIDKTAQTLTGAKREDYNKELGVIHSSIARALGEMRAIAGGMCLPELEHLAVGETIRRASR